MKPTRYIAVMGILNALASTLVTYPALAAAKQRPAHGSPATKDQDHTNAQWTADPERGWVRAGERRDGEQQRESTKGKRIRGKQGNERKITKH